MRAPGACGESRSREATERVSASAEEDRPEAASEGHAEAMPFLSSEVISAIVGDVGRL